MRRRYELRKDEDEDTWRVIEVTTGFVVVVNTTLLNDLDMDTADDLVDLLNHIDRQKATSTEH